MGGLPDVLSHPISGANQNFLRPFNTSVSITPETLSTNSDFYLHPLLRHGGKRFLLLDRAVCASAFLQSLLVRLKPVTPVFSKKILGPGTEKILRNALEKHQISAIEGTYRIDDEDGECDLVIETEKTVFFIEVKKKMLTPEARSGIDIYLILDLAESLLQAQIQAGEHELRLSSNQSIELRNNGLVTLLELKGRSVERIAVTLLDYGSFQDRTLLKQFMEICLSTRYSLNEQYQGSDTSLQKRFEKLNKVLERSHQQVEKLSRIKNESAQFFYHCWFLSIPQLLILLDNVQGPESFKEKLFSIRAITFGSLDFYFEYAQMRKMQSDALTEKS